ncbi:MAG: nucleoside-diphosphate sugar epimerase [Rhodanobacter denitrificans]|uniref:Nucleoside-diphosphate sugar epimerase n=1 Tax=Rhodanobacter denitrificans TaxID=666685 RepID=A0A2W5K5W6_9GAMM|nr:MAG: nucleoside-diphosphate sugar epimerase [Rhodanobacter denitrificans]
MSGVGSARGWVVSDGIAGNRRQATALAQAMGLDAAVVTIGLRAPWDWFAPRLSAGAGLAVRRLDGAALAPPWPELAIGCGRRAAWLTRLLKARSGGRCYTVQILDPRIDADHFDVVVAPRHDGLSGPRVIETIGSLNPVGPAWLAEARTRFAALAQWPQPRVAVLIGAGNAAQRIDAAYFRRLIDALAARHAADGGSFLVTLSRRTPAALRPWLRQAFAAFPGLFWEGEADGENPYAGLLAFADRIVVTPDSVNMLSEAAATGRPVATFAPDPIGGKFASFHEALHRHGWLQPLDEPPRVPARPLAETAAVAAEVLRRWRAA